MSQPDPQIELVKAIAQFYDDPLGHVLFSYHWGQGQLQGRTGPQKWQREFLEDVAAEVRRRRFDGTTAVAPIQFSTASGHGIGKAQRLDCVVPTPWGPQVWGSVKVGDFLFGPDGQPVAVLATQTWSDRPVYRVTMSDGSSTVVDENHEWTVRGRAQRRSGVSGWTIVSTKQLLDGGVNRPNGVAAARQWEIPPYSAVQMMPAADLDVDPYLMGVWLGDGTKSCGAITSADPEVFDTIRSRGYDVSPFDRNSGNGPAQTRTIYGISRHLPACTTYTASVPQKYMLGSVEQRLDLLHGLMDTDGWVEQSGTCMFGSVSEALARDVLSLARSLGVLARWKGAVHKSYTDAAGQRVAGAPFYLVSMTPSSLPLFKLARKQGKLRPVEARYTKRWISSIEPEGRADTMCVTVARADGLYLADDYIVTHNSAIVAWLIRWIMDTRPFAKGVVTANTGEQLRTKTWAELAKWHHLGITRHWWQLNAGAGSMNYYHKDYREQWRCDAQTSREENSEAFAGLHAANSTPFYIFDEASGIPDKIFEVREGGLTDGEPMTFDFGNPTRNTGRFFQNMEGRFRNRYIRRFIDSRTVEQTNKELFKQWAEDYGEDSDFFKVRVRGMFPDAGSLQLIPMSLYEENVHLEVTVQPHDPLVMAVDVARFGDDRSVIWLRQGRDAESQNDWRRQILQKVDTMQLAARVAEIAGQKRPDAVLIDGGGVGGGVVDRCRQLGLEVIEVNFGARPTQAGMANMRAQMWSNLKDALSVGVRLPEMEDLRTDLTSVEYGYTLKNELKLESKEDMKKRGLASPDLGDALALTYALPVYPNRPGFAGVPNVQRIDYDPYDD